MADEVWRLVQRGLEGQRSKKKRRLCCAYNKCVVDSAGLLITTTLEEMPMICSICEQYVHHGECHREHLRMHVRGALLQAAQGEKIIQDQIRKQHEAAKSEVYPATMHARTEEDGTNAMDAFYRTRRGYRDDLRPKGRYETGVTSDECDLGVGRHCSRCGSERCPDNNPRCRGEEKLDLLELAADVMNEWGTKEVASIIDRDLAIWGRNVADRKELKKKKVKDLDQQRDFCQDTPDKQAAKAVAANQKN